MDMDERHEQIIALAGQQKRVRTHLLSQRFHVSPETIRKDLQMLHDQGALIRVHGGARARTISTESAYDRRRSDRRSAKEAIAEAAVAEIRDDSTIYLDYGTTTLAIAQRLVHDGRRLSVVTNALPIAQVLSEAPDIETIVLGGIMRRNERSLMGPLAEAAAAGLHMDTGFFGCAGIHQSAGITNPHALESALSRKVMRNCSRVVVVADASKLGSIAVHRVIELDEVETIITSSMPAPDLVAALDNVDTTLIIAKE